MTRPQHSSQPKISLLHATRGRPEQAAECRKRWLRLARSPELIEHLFAVDFDDSLSRQMLTPFNPLIVNDPSGGCVAAWNMAAAHSTGDVLVQLSDDWVPPEGWDHLILSTIGELSKPSVLRVSDGHRTDDLLCMAILTRARYQQQNFLFSPEYQGVYSDDEFSFRACKDGLVVHAPDLCFTHAHPHYDDRIEMDQTYLIQNSDERKRNGLLTFARRNPDAFGQWVHHGTDQRHYHAKAGLGDIQCQLVDAINERTRLLGKNEELMKEAAHLKAAAEKWKAAVEEWNSRSWVARALHKLRMNDVCSPNKDK